VNDEGNLELALDHPILSEQFERPLEEQLIVFREFGTPTKRVETRIQADGASPISIPTFVNEFWTAKQRAANRLHEISYRACFKPQLPRFFIQRLTNPGERVYDPFMGRGTTLLEAALLGRLPAGCDINPLSVHMLRPRLRPPALQDVAKRLSSIPLTDHDEFPEDLLVFYHPDTLRELCALKKYLLTRKSAGELDHVDDWIWMVGLNRLTGHSRGFFSVYTLPPNQATSVTAQRKINAKRNQTPERRFVPALIQKKSRKLLADCTPKVRDRLWSLAEQAQLLTSLSAAVPQIASGSVSLVVTSPPFLNVVDYAGDNWLRCWLIGVDPKTVQVTVPNKLERWQAAMTDVFRELHRVLRRGGHIAFEVGEIQAGKLKLEEAVVPCGIKAGLNPLLVLINDQKFTKTANCWGVDNNSKGTNTNRIVLFQK
jgi:hypothetical protein